MGCGGVLSFEVADARCAMAVAGAVRVIERGTSLGGTETLIEHRASIEPEERRVSPPGLLRTKCTECSKMLEPHRLGSV